MCDFPESGVCGEGDRFGGGEGGETRCPWMGGFAEVGDIFEAHVWDELGGVKESG